MQPITQILGSAIIIALFAAIPATADEEPPLIEAVTNGTLQEVEALLLDPAIRENLDAADALSDTALTKASRLGRADVVRALLDAGADVRGATHSAHPMYAFFIAIIGEHLDVMDLFVERGFGVNDANANGVTALMLAADNDRIEATAWLLERGADPLSKNRWGRTPLSIAKRRKRTPEVLRLLSEELEQRQPARRSSDNVVTQAQATIPGKKVQDLSTIRVRGPAMNDEQALAALCSYVEGETTFGTFQMTFSQYFTRQSARDPDSSPGEFIRNLHHEQTIDGVPPEKTNLLMASMNSRMMGTNELLHHDLLPYVSGTYVLGHIKPGQGSASYATAPSSFNVISKLVFSKGILTQFAVAGCNE